MFSIIIVLQYSDDCTFVSTYIFDLYGGTKELKHSWFLIMTNY